MRTLFALVMLLASSCGVAPDESAQELAGGLPERARHSGVVPAPHAVQAQAISPPGAPQNLVVKYDTSIQEQRITWTAPSSETPAGYQLYLAIDGGLEVIRDIQYPGDDGIPGVATLGLPGVGWAFALTAYVLGDCGEGRTLADGTPICEGPMSNFAFSTI